MIAFLQRRRVHGPGRLPVGIALAISSALLLGGWLMPASGQTHPAHPAAPDPDPAPSTDSGSSTADTGGAGDAGAASGAESAGTRPADAQSADLADSVATLFGPIFERTPWWGWVVLFTAILLGLVAGKLVQMLLRGAGARLARRGWHLRGTIFEDAASPASLMLLTLGLTLGLQFVALDGSDGAPTRLSQLAGNALRFLYLLAIGWFVFNLVDLVDLALRRRTAATPNKLAEQIAPLVRKALRIFIVVVFVLVVAQNVFGVNITAWLAGLGIAGLAVSLAAQDSIKNLFGSLTVLLDKPFAIGDRIVFDGIEGIVEEIGFRSTRLRTFPGHLITVPNMKFTDGVVENVSERPFVRRSMNVTITYDTPPEKIEQAVDIIRDLLADPDFSAPFDLEKRPPRVYFNDLNADSLNLAVTYWYFLDEPRGRDWWSYQDHAHRFNLRLFRAFGEAGIDFAFPTQTLYLAGDPQRELTIRLHDALEDARP